MDNKPLVIALCLPMRDWPSAHFSMSLAALTYVTRTKLMLVRGHTSKSAAAARNIILEKLETLEQMTKTRADWTVWFDDDMVFPSNAAAQLISHNKDICGASYLRRTPPHELLGEPDGPLVQTTGLSRFKRIPAGVLAVKRDVFDRVGRWTVTDEDGEDILFCDRARAKGFEVWCDLDLTREIKHVGETLLEVDPEKSTLIIPPQPTIVGVRANGRG